jgi:hypothetical protein
VRLFYNEKKEFYSSTMSDSDEPILRNARNSQGNFNAGESEQRDNDVEAKSANEMQMDEHSEGSDDDNAISLEDVENKTFVENIPSCSHYCLRKHPDILVESAALSGATMPPLNQKLCLPSKTFLEGRLTMAQLDGVLRACAQHELFLPDGARKGFFLGDGAGVGKGRQQAAMIFHNANRGRKLAVWMSVSADLIQDARRDLADIGAGHIRLHDLRDYRMDQDLRAMSELRTGVLFCTYSLFVSGRTLDQSRIEQIIRLLGDDFDGLVTFDEIHRAKNLGLEAGSRGSPVKGSRTALCVQELQARLPQARVLYVSATGATEVEHMACFSRLGLWGPGTSFRRRSVVLTLDHSIQVTPSKSESRRVTPSHSEHGQSESIRVNLSHSPAASHSESIRVTPSHSESLRVTPSHSESLRVTRAPYSRLDGPAEPRP